MNRTNTIRDDSKRFLYGGRVVDACLGGGLVRKNKRGKYLTMRWT